GAAPVPPTATTRTGTDRGQARLVDTPAHARRHARRRPNGRADRGLRAVRRSLVPAHLSRRGRRRGVAGIALSAPWRPGGSVGWTGVRLGLLSGALPGRARQWHQPPRALRAAWTGGRAHHHAAGLAATGRGYGYGCLRWCSNDADASIRTGGRSRCGIPARK